MTTLIYQCENYLSPPLDTPLYIQKKSGQSVEKYLYLMILNDVTARGFNVLYGLIINFPNLPSGRKLLKNIIFLFYNTSIVI